MKIGLHCWVTGRVQGVAFRYHTAQLAIRLGLTGEVRNLKDGRVEVKVYGEATSVETFCLWLHQGPPAATVTQAHCEKIPNPLFPEEFKIAPSE